MNPSRRQPLLRIPPFPGARPADFTRHSGSSAPWDWAELDLAMESAARLKVGGTFWAAQPALPTSYTLVAAQDASARSLLLKEPPSTVPIVRWDGSARRARSEVDDSVILLNGPCDPWHLLSGAVAAYVDADSDLALLAGLADVPVKVTHPDGEMRSPAADRAALRHSFQSAVQQYVYFNPFTAEPISLTDAFELLGFWRKLVDSNRDIGSAIGFASWKQPTIAPLLWGGGRAVPFHTKPQRPPEDKRIAVWKSRVPAGTIAGLERSGAELIEVEDGFIRSAGLGADCVPPLSIVVDRVGVHFDPRTPSELELLLEREAFGTDILERARALREIIVERGISKYGSIRTAAESRRSERRHLLVPGQVEDDRAVLASDEVIGNAELLRRARKDAPDAYIIYKPHPDVEAGHRLGAVPEDLCSQLADEVVRDGPISSWIEMVDEVQVNTSLAGFEALLRGKTVTTHGVPFYAGWGLTRDLGDVPDRRTARRTLDELVAAVLLVYPRYLDPVTGIPCPPEILIRRLSHGSAGVGATPLVRLRRLQGRLKRRISGLRFW